MFISIMKKLSSFDRYLSEGYDNICDYNTYKYYLKLRRRNLFYLNPIGLRGLFCSFF